MSSTDQNRQKARESDKESAKTGENTFDLNFAEKILGFEEVESYELIFSDEDMPFYFLKAKESEAPCFIVCDPVCFVPDYKIDYGEEILEKLQAKDPNQLKCIVIANIQGNVADTTVNLKSPIIFNPENGLAGQFVLNDVDYPIKHKLFNS